MNVLIAIDSFKDCLSSKELSDIIEKSILEVCENYNVCKVPIADGGEGTYQVLMESLAGKGIRMIAKDPLFNDIFTEYGLLKDGTAIIEMAKISGLSLVKPENRNPLFTTTYGLGQIILNAIDRGVKNFIIGIGGSATNDAGIGMLKALGFDFLDKKYNSLKPIGFSLNHIHSICPKNVKPELKDCNFLVACDVNNPLFGKNGAAFVYAGQKGASQSEIKILDQGLKNFAEVVRKKSNISNIVSGVGSAGGLGFAFQQFLNAELKPGVDILFEKICIEDKIKSADIIITGEGKMDFQTVMGKAPIGLAKICKKYNKTVIALVGNMTDDAVKTHSYGITSIFSIIDSPISLDQAIQTSNTKRLISKSVKEIFRLIKKLSL